MSLTWQMEKRVKFIANEKKLYTDDGQFIKELSCPLRKKWENLLKLDEKDLKRRCNACGKNVLNLSSLSDDQVLAIASYDPDVCVYIRSDADNLEWIGREDASGWFMACSESFASMTKGCRIIKTARTKNSMNQAAKDGYKVLVKIVEPNADICSKIAVRQDPETQQVEFIGDFRDGLDDLTIPFTFYNTTYQDPPLAAYIIPQDIKLGERVYILDIIENIKEMEWNQGDSGRQQSGYAVWNGKGFDLEPVHVKTCMG